MTPVTISKTEYKKMLKVQEELYSQVAALREFVIETVKEELNPSAIKRLEKRSRILDCGKGKYFNSISSFQSYLRSL